MSEYLSRRDISAPHDRTLRNMAWAMPTDWSHFFRALPDRTIVTDRDLLVDGRPEAPRAHVDRAHATGRQGDSRANHDQVRDQTGPPRETADGYRERLLKYIPAEGLAFYLTLDGIVRSGTSTDRKVEFWALLGAF